MRRRSYCLLALLLLLASCAPNTSSTAPTPTPLPTAIVLAKPTYTVQRGVVESSLSFTGRVSPIQEAPLYFRNNGRVLQVYVTRGGEVKAGDLLAELDVAALRRQLAQAELAVETAQTELDGAESARSYDLARAQYNLELEQIALAKLKAYDTNVDVALAQTELNAAQVSLDQAQSDYDDSKGQPDDLREMRARALQQAQLAYQRAKAAYDQAVQQAVQYTYDVQSQETRVELAQLEVDHLKVGADPRLAQALAQAQLELEDLQAQVTDTVILAPFDGMVTAVSTGAGQAVEAFQPVLVVANPAGLEVTAELTAEQMGNLREGQAAAVVTLDSSEQSFSATIRRLPYPYGSGGSSTGMANKDTVTHLTAELQGVTVQPGDLVQVTVVLERKEDALWLPKAALRTFQGRQFVVVQEGAGQQRVNVTVGIESEERVEIVEGLEEGQVVVGP